MIRPANQSDLSFILEIMNEAILNTTSIYDYDAKDKKFINEWFQDKININFPVLIAEQENKIVAYGTYGDFRNKEGYKFTVEHSVYVHPHFQKKGIGKKLITRLINIAQTNNVHSIIAGIDAENSTSIKLHKSLGFKEVGYIKEAAYKFDRWLDLVFYQYLIK